ncbi:hypothetical protein DN051_39390 [Streptomyces cadmiisoli]|uniref:Uncharacterized protein n=1 Tax=Streptomyces cadmiisoli TaxID=2184053 RepID=A0A2Z4JB44_9ACTN|nr:hypothetical protein DN051_39390 [Streptomyces cadmiisoli]
MATSDGLRVRVREGDGAPAGRTALSVGRGYRGAAGLTLPWSSGVVKGHVNRVKKPHRQMFGRAGFDLLPSVSSCPHGTTLANLQRVLADGAQPATCRVSSRDFCCSTAVHSFAWGSEAVLR